MADGASVADGASAGGLDSSPECSEAEAAGAEGEEEAKPYGSNANLQQLESIELLKQMKLEERRLGQLMRKDPVTQEMLKHMRREEVRLGQLVSASKREFFSKAANVSFGDYFRGCIPDLK